ncbi:MAG: KpsF/GutQ family sugar-phosphate isomerase [Gammaproteobacteria bacterium]|nr:KpsF/GutQ family sugar-phosphate isomerase [Gammaproteobacteria bacterium]MDH5613987.1 KpsF/GutQ family sugar-phosphate isomerase [Gammaproteobacteria bacterium]
MNESTLISLGRSVIEIEANAVSNLKNRIDATFAKACQLMLGCEGRIVVVGMGKSGHIGGKIAATLASTGSPAFFVHPGEASHGDLGMITTKDVVIAISNSGETSEILTILPLIKRQAVPLIGMTGNPGSTLAKASTVHINVGVEKEACPLNLAPTSSTTAALAMGDALAVSLLDARGFTEDDFAMSHPGGSLGRRLLLLIEDVMHTGNTIPKVMEDASLKNALMEMSQKGLGMTAIVDKKDQVIGVFTDGDLRRVFDQKIDLHKASIAEVMTSPCKTIKPHVLAAEALKEMETNKINGFLVTDDNNKLVGAFNMHDLLKAGVV